MTITTDLITGFVGATLGICTLIGLGVRFVLVPYLRRHIADPVEAVREQVQNSHSTNMRHDIDDLGSGLGTLDGKVQTLDGKVDAQAVQLARLEALLTLMREDGVTARAEANQRARDVHTDQERKLGELWTAVNQLRHRPPAT